MAGFAQIGLTGLNNAYLVVFLFMGLLKKFKLTSIFLDDTSFNN